MAITNDQGKNYIKYWYLYVIGAEAVAIVSLWNANQNANHAKDVSNNKTIDAMVQFLQASGREDRRTRPENYTLVPFIDPTDSSRTLIAVPRRSAGDDDQGAPE